VSFDLSAYEPVEERLARFWQDHPEGRIVTQLVESVDGNYIVRAEVYRLPLVQGVTLVEGHAFPDSTGYAQEREGTSPVNKTSALENCETSAIGRALANLGYAPKGQRPSREEMAKAATRTGLSSRAASSASVRKESADTGSAATSEGAEVMGKHPAPSGTTHKPGCSNPGMTDLRPDGKRMPSGWLRCEGCGATFKEAEVS
jgi:hypothetical protein